LNNNAPAPQLTVLLGALVALPALGTDFFVPALPALAHDLDAPVTAAQLTLTTYFVGLAAGMLLWGPMSDRYGRRPALFAGLALMLVSSLLTVFLHSVLAVATARLAQGLAMASGAVVARTVVRDLYVHEHAARLLASMTMVFSIVPLAAPLAGALLAQAAGWEAIFVAMSAAAACLMAAVAVGLRETAPSERRSVHPLAIARTFAGILGTHAFYKPYALVFCAQAGILAWVSNSSFTLVRGLGVGATAYALMFGMVMLGQIFGAWSSSRLVLRLGIARLVRLGAALMFLAGTGAAVLAWGEVGHWLAVVLPFMVFLYGSALVVPNAMAAALGPFPHAAGSASSLMGAIGFTAGAIISAGLGAAFDGTARPMATLAAVGGAAAFMMERVFAKA
jgi:MFS transporter, DHA1 family, multidrug resistance protein